LDNSIGETIGQPQEGIWRPALSPDGSKIVVTGEENNERDLWIHDIGRSTKTRLTFADGTEVTPNWSPDGTLIYFSHPAFSPEPRICEVAADGSDEPRELTPGGFQSISGDGEWLAFEREDEETGLDLWMLPLGGGGEPEVFLATDAREENVQLSPDGRWLSYESNESGRGEVYVKPFPSGSGKWQVSVNGGDWQRWSPESDRLFFVNENKLHQVDVETGSGLRLSTPKQVIDGSEHRLLLDRGYAVAPGGERIIAVREVEKEGGEEPSPSGILVVQNWLSEF
jgi:Tol biopolymer transport system component